MKTFTLIFLTFAAVLFEGCSKSGIATAESEKPHLHVDQPPHGGTPIDLGEEYHLELVLDGANGTLDAFVLDDEMEEFIRSSSKSFEITAQAGGRGEKLHFDAIANRATGETTGDTSQFEAKADWLKTVTNFDGMLDAISVRGTTYTNISVNFPKGSDADDKENK